MRTASFSTIVRKACPRMVLVARRRSRVISVFLQQDSTAPPWYASPRGLPSRGLTLTKQQGFLPEVHFEEPYAPPNWYLQVFPPNDPSICANNCTFVNAIGTVGNYHVGIYTRFLIMFLVDPLTTPQQGLMKFWVDFTRWMKSNAPGGAFDFFTYGELIYWFLFVILVNPFRWKWAFFVLFGIGTSLPMAVVEREAKFRQEVNNMHIPQDKQVKVNGL